MTAVRPAVMRLYRGVSLDFSFTWPDQDGTPLDLTGWVLEVFEPTPALVGRITLTFVSAALGSVQGRIVWSDDIPLGRVSSFRIRATNGSDAIALPLIMVEVL